MVWAEPGPDHTAPHQEDSHMWAHTHTHAVGPTLPYHIPPPTHSSPWHVHRGCVGPRMRDPWSPWRGEDGLRRLIHHNPVRRAPAEEAL